MHVNVLTVSVVVSHVEGATKQHSCEMTGCVRRNMVEKLHRTFDEVFALTNLCLFLILYGFSFTLSNGSPPHYSISLPPRAGHSLAPVRIADRFPPQRVLAQVRVQNSARPNRPNQTPLVEIKKASCRAPSRLLCCGGSTLQFRPQDNLSNLQANSMVVRLDVKQG